MWPKFRAMFSLSLLSAGVLVVGNGVAVGQSFTTPAAVTLSQTTAFTNGSATLAVAVDASGNAFFTLPGAGSFVEDPANGGAQITLINGSLSYPKGVAVDTNGFAYVSDYHGHLWQVPVGGGTAVDVLAPCNPIDAYYLGTQVVAVDGAHNVYTAGQNETSLFKITPAATCSVVAGVTLDANSHIAVDAAGDIAYSTGGVLYSLPVTATTAVAVAATFDSINGLRADPFGNVFVTTNATVTEVPFVNGALSGAQAFAVLPFSSAYDIGIGADGSLYTTDGTNITRSYSGSLHFAPGAVGTASASQTATVLFDSAQIVTSIRYVSGDQSSGEIVNTGAGTCAAGPYAAGASCTLVLTDTPSNIGVRDGAVILSSATGDIASLIVSAEGSGAGLVADPGTQTSLGSGYTEPDGVAVAASGSVVVADEGSGSVYYLAAGSATPVAIATGLSQPAGVAIGPNGAVYVADRGSNSIEVVPYSGTAYGAQAVAVSGLNAPSALAFAKNGDLYVANTGAGTVVRIPNQGGSLNLADMAVFASGFTAPSGLAFDTAGDLFVADRGAGTVSELTGGAPAVISSGLTSPGALAVDDSGTLYIQQTGVATVLRIPFTGGSYSTNGATKLGSGLTTPASIAADSAGDLYVADSAAASVVMIQRTAGSLPFGRVNVNSTSAAESETLSNDGDLSLTFGSPLYTAAGNTGDFAVAASSTGSCAAAGTLAAGAVCGISATFTPSTTGYRAETLTIGSNVAPITVTLNGSGVQLATTTLTLKQVSPTGAVSFGQTVTVSASVAATTGTPTGTVQFAVNGVPYGSPVALNNGSSSIAISGLPGGNNTITATYSGDNTFASSTGTPLIVAVAFLSTSTNLTASISSATPVAPGTSVTLTATIVSNASGASPTGTVTFTGNGSVLGTVGVNTAGVAMLTSTSFPTGTYSIVATYSGDSGFAGSTSNAVSVSILAPQYILTNTPTALTVSAPGSVSTTFTVSPISGYTGGVDMACSGLPKDTQCSFTPGTVYFANSINGGTTVAPSPETVTLTLTTDTAPPTPVAGWLLPLGGLLLLGGWRARKKLPGLVLVLVVLLSGSAMLSLSGCGSTTPMTPGGTSNVVVTFTGSPNGTTTVPTSGTGNIVKSFSFVLTVK